MELIELLVQQSIQLILTDQPYQQEMLEYQGLMSTPQLIDNQFCMYDQA